MLSSMMYCVGRGIVIGVVIVCCILIVGVGILGIDRFVNKDVYVLCELNSILRIVVYLKV